MLDLQHSPAPWYRGASGVTVFDADGKKVLNPRPDCSPAEKQANAVLVAIAPAMFHHLLATLGLPQMLEHFPELKDLLHGEQPREGGEG